MEEQNFANQMSNCWKKTMKWKQNWANFHVFR